MKLNGKMETAPKMRMTHEMKTTSKMVYDPKKEDIPKFKDDPTMKVTSQTWMKMTVFPFFVGLVSSFI